MSDFSHSNHRVKGLLALFVIGVVFTYWISVSSLRANEPPVRELPRAELSLYEKLYLDAPDWFREAWEHAKTEEETCSVLKRGHEQGVPFVQCTTARQRILSNHDSLDRHCAPMEPAEAIRILGRFSDNQCPGKPWALAWAYSHGIGVSGDAVLSQHYFRKAALYESLPGMNYLGAAQFYFGGKLDSVREALTDAQRWLSRAREWSDAERIEQAFRHLKGEGVIRDPQLSYFLLYLVDDHTAESGFALYEGMRDGLLFGWSYEPLFGLLEDASRAGHAAAQRELGQIHMRVGDRQNLEQAYMYFYAAKLNGAEKVVLELEQVASLLSKKKIADIQKQFQRNEEFLKLWVGVPSQ